LTQLKYKPESEFVDFARDVDRLGEAAVLAKSPADLGMRETAALSSLFPVLAARGWIATSSSRHVVKDMNPVGSPDIWRAVCLLEVVSVQWIPLCPWARTQQVTTSGSGFIISGRRIVTNAHVVANAIDIRVRPHGSSKRFAAKVTTFGPDVDLGIVEISPAVADDFWELVKDVRPVELATSLPELQESVQAFGFPTGGRTICVTEGVVSRIDSIDLTPPADTSIVIQIDAAINPGSSGGPVMNSCGLVAGVSFCKDSSRHTDNIGYVIPAEVVRTFLDRAEQKDGYTLSPSVPYRWHKLENQSLRAAHRVPDGVSGVLLTSVSPSVSSALRRGDVLTKIDGCRIADDGQLTLRGSELIQHRYVLRNKRIAEPTVFTVFRDGLQVEMPPVELTDLPPICPRWPEVDYFPEFLILGALALVPLAQGHHWYKECPSELKATIERWRRRWPGDRDGKDQLVLLVTVFAHELTFGYQRGWRVVESYNGTPITSLRHLRDMWFATREEVAKAQASAAAEPEEGQPKKGSSCSAIFVRLGLQSDDDVVLDAKAAMDAEEKVLKTHAIEKASFIKGDETDKS
jgi:S1-C subfamily serine protease